MCCQRSWETDPWWFRRSSPSPWSGTRSSSYLRRMGALTGRPRGWSRSCGADSRRRSSGRTRECGLLRWVGLKMSTIYYFLSNKKSENVFMKKFSDPLSENNQTTTPRIGSLGFEVPVFVPMRAAKSSVERPLRAKLCWSWDKLKAGEGNRAVSLALDILPSFLPFGTSQVGPPACCQPKILISTSEKSSDMFLVAPASIS